MCRPFCNGGLTLSEGFLWAIPQLHGNLRYFDSCYINRASSSGSGKTNGFAFFHKQRLANSISYRRVVFSSSGFFFINESFILTEEAAQ